MIDVAEVSRKLRAKRSGRDGRQVDSRGRTAACVCPPLDSSHDRLNPLTTAGGWLVGSWPADARAAASPASEAYGGDERLTTS